MIMKFSSKKFGIAKTSLPVQSEITFANAGLTETTFIASSKGVKTLVTNFPF